MSDQCEALFSSEAIMHRLSALLQQNQEYCTDTDCDGETLPRIDQNNLVIIMGMWVAFAIFMYALRPSSLRTAGDPQSTKNNGNGRNEDNHDNDQPPAVL
ncbi:Small integral membrane protein 14 [Strongyloides ratti]|uniref:Small integral membrane protein 14 n=1 Tax=Strongyloides ratti TaxID=34506 RepID=A0A090LDN9_STRRB|nr:Small integral membrane protein 14 [Strongyloides ratti]CEF65625.1 Small integral membrane protein 14 [Strongyloides ratti]